MVEVYVFSSENLTNIWAGIGARQWAVSQKQGDNGSIRTKASDLPVGALGVLYCVETQSFTSPFLVTSKPDMTKVVENIWPQPWKLPFSIFPFGSPARQLHKDRLATLLPSLQAGLSWDRLLQVSPLTVFAANQLTVEDWSVLATHLVEA